MNYTRWQHILFFTPYQSSCSGRRSPFNRLYTANLNIKFTKSKIYQLTLPNEPRLTTCSHCVLSIFKVLVFCLLLSILTRLWVLHWSKYCLQTFVLLFKSISSFFILFHLTRRNNAKKFVFSESLMLVNTLMLVDSVRGTC